jgi:hypothetical protein
VGQSYDIASGRIESIFKQFVNNNVVNPSNPSRKINQIVIAPDLNRGQEDRWRGRYEKLSDKLQEIGEYVNMGWDISLDIDLNAWVFDVNEGKNVTVNQDLLPPVIFSVEFDNVKGQSFTDSSLNFSNVGYAGGKGDAEDRLIQQVGNAEGLYRIESFLDCSSAEDLDELTIEGNRKLEEYKKIVALESKVMDYGSFIYGQDWDLGDIVTIQNRKWNLTMDTRIVEAKEIFEAGGFNLEVVFGSNIPTLIDKIKKLEQRKLIEVQSGSPGESGQDGKSLEFTWNGTSLGVRQEGSTEFSYSLLKGEKGDTGPQGPPGQSITYTHMQITPSDTWVITHNLNKYPSVTIVDSAGSVFIGDIKYISENEIQLEFSSAFAGKAYLN